MTYLNFPKLAIFLNTSSRGGGGGEPLRYVAVHMREQKHVKRDPFICSRTHHAYFTFVTTHHKRALKSASTCFWFAGPYNHPIAVPFEKNRGPVMLIISAWLVMD